MFEMVEQPSIGVILTPRVPLSFSTTPARSAQPAPLMGRNTEAVLTELLGLTTAELAPFENRTDGVNSHPA